MTLDPRITFSRTSLGTYYDSAGVLKYAAHNMAWPSVGFSGWSALSSGTVTANSILAPDGTTTGAKLNHPTAGTVPGGGVNGGNVPSSDIYRRILSVYAKAGTKSWLTLANTTSGTTNVHCWFNLATGTVGTRGTNWISSGIEDVGGGWYRCWALSGAASFLFILRVGETDNTVNCTSSGDIYVWGAQCEWVTTATTPSTYLPTTSAAVHGARFDYDPVSHAPKGLLIEESRINSFNASQDFSNGSWNKIGATITVDQIVAPDGTTTADLMTATATPAYAQYTFNLTTSTTYIQSVYAKKGTADWIVISAHDGVTSRTAYFNLATGMVGAYTLDAALLAVSMQDVGNGWYRCVMTRVGTSAATNEFVNIGPCNADASTTVSVGKTVYLWGAQFENGAFLTSYIPTLPASAVTRTADVATMTGTNFSSWYNQAQGTFVAEFDVFSVAPVQAIIAADDNSANNQTKLYLSSANPTGYITRSATIQANIATSAITAGSVHKFGMSFAPNDVAVCRNGGTVGTDITATMPILTQLRIGVDAVPSRMSGYIRRIRFYNVAKSDAELQALTALTGPAAMPTVTIVWTTDELDTTPSFTVAYTGALVGDVLELQVDDAYTFGSAATETNTLDSTEVAAGTLTMGATIPALTVGLQHYARIKVTRGAEVVYSTTMTSKRMLSPLDLDFTASDTLDSRITFSRTTLGTYYGVDGLIHYAGHNIFVQSENFNTSWTKLGSATVTSDATSAPNGTMTADKINVPGTGAGVNTTTGSPPASALPFIMSIYAKAGSKNFLILGGNPGIARYCYFNLATGAVGSRDAAGWSASGIENVGNGWYRCWGKFVPQAGSIGVQFVVGETDGTLTLTSAGDLYLWGAQCEFVTLETAPSTYIPTTSTYIGGPRFDYDPVSHAPKGLLIEESRINVAFPTEDFSVWTATSATVALNQTTAPDGTANADRITASATSNAHVSLSRTISTGVAGTWSIYVKKDTSDWVWLTPRGAVVEEPKAYFNLATGTVGTVESPITAASIQAVGNGWYRCVVNRLGSGAGPFRIGVCDADNSTNVTIGRAAYIWGAQVEVGAFVSSYIPATASTTRAADVATMIGTNFSSWYNEAAGTFVTAFDFNGITSGSGQGIMQVDVGTTGDSIRFGRASANLALVMDDGAVTQASMTFGAAAANTAYKIGVSFAANDIAACVNGGTVQTDTGATMPSPTQMRIGTDASPNYLNGHIRRIQFFPVAKSDAELITLTALPVVLATFDGTATNVSLSGGNLTATHTTTTTSSGARSTALKTSGKYYFEGTFGATNGQYDCFGILMSTGSYDHATNSGASVSAVYRTNNAQIFSNGSLVANLGSNITAGDVISVAVDLDARLVWFRKNGSIWLNNASANPATGTLGLTVAGAGVSLAPFVGFGGPAPGNIGDNLTANFGQTAYVYAAPSGFGNWTT